MKPNLKKLTVSAIFIALSTVLSELIPSISLPFGGSITLLSMVPVCLIGILFGVRWGVFANLAYGVIQLFFGLGNVTYALGIAGIAGALAVLLFDYVIAYGVLGFTGVFLKTVKNKTLAVVLGVLLVCLLRYLCHFITGVTIWREIADIWGAIWYSVTYNATYMIPEMITTPIAVALLLKTKAIDQLV
ncbi:MAG: energy-coupled thiamine transporter ThiT [Clostridia bacterium]|nr:energy-coupled thiamine transporter ThiT [Clostridia bacterium]